MKDRGRRRQDRFTASPRAGFDANAESEKRIEQLTENFKPPADVHVLSECRVHEISRPECSGRHNPSLIVKASAGFVAELMSSHCLLELSQS